MSLDVASLGIDRLSVGERLELIEIIWDSLPESVSSDEVPPEHRALLEKRLAAAEAHPETGVPWSEILNDLSKKP
jgi:putative addiction module component (TIGR02574 family)